jgi:hypothetical protein
MKPSLLDVGDNLLFHTECSFPESIIPYGIQQLTKSPFNHIATVIQTNNSVKVIEAVASGYKIHDIGQAITLDDKRVSVFRYHSDGVGGNPLTDQQKAGIITTALKYQNAPYGYSQIVLLALLCEINNTTFASYVLKTASELIEQVIESKVNAFINMQQTILSLFFQNLQNANKGMLICSEGAYRLYVENGINLRILNDNSREKYYNATGDVLSLYQSTRKEDLLGDPISDFITPRDIAESPDMLFLDDLEI